MSLYTDRGSHYFRTTRDGEIHRSSPTHVGRALEQLGVELIGAFSPQARGRSERMFGTLQDRLIKELAKAPIAVKRHLIRHGEASGFVYDKSVKQFKVKPDVGPPETPKQGAQDEIEYR